MTSPQVVVRSRSRGRQGPPAPGVGWQLLGGVGVVFVVVGGADLLLAVLPTGFGNPEWEFGTVTSVLDGMPVPTLGLVAVLAAARARGSRLARVVAVLLGLLALAVVAAAVLYATTVPIALRSVTEPVVRTGLLKAVAKTAVQCVVYPVGLTWLAVAGWRRVEPT